MAMHRKTHGFVVELGVDCGHLMMKSAGSRVSLKVENALMYGKEMYRRYRLGRQNDL